MNLAVADIRPAVPAHVPETLVRDVDYTDLIRGDEDSQEGWWRLQQTMPDLFWTRRNGGHWIVTRGALIEEIQQDHTRFSHREVRIPPVPSPWPMMIKMDPPRHTDLRKVVMPALNKTALKHLEDEARAAAREIVAKIAPRGKCEFVSEFSNVMPIVVFLNMMGLPLDHREMLLERAEVALRGATLEARTAGMAWIGNYVKEWVDRRRDAVTPDLISKIAHSDVGARPITYEETVGMCIMLMLGGLDTVASMVGFIARYLAMHPEARRRLREDPAIMQSAIEELIRRHGLSNTARYVTQDMEFHGVRLREGDLIAVPNCLFGLDDRIHANPLEVDFDRPTPIRHAAFGNGVHICPGGILARREIRVFIEEWLACVPDFAIAPGTHPKMVTDGLNALEELHLVWDVAQ